MTTKRSPLESARSTYRPRVPSILDRSPAELSFRAGSATESVRDGEEIRRRFPRTYGRGLLELVEGPSRSDASALRVGVVLSGGQAPGGHNVIAGLFDGIRRASSASVLFGFLGGPAGILRDRSIELKDDRIDDYRNTGGFDMIGSGRDKIESAEHLQRSRDTCRRLELDGLVVIGGDDSNTNAAVLAEHFLEHGIDTTVVGVPKTIDGDLKIEQVESAFGFDTATKVYSELIGNICRDAKSAAKYWHFIKLMGRSSSHVTLECALQTAPNVTLISEEVEARSWTLDQLVDRVGSVVTDRADAGRSYGVCLIPEGLIEFIPEIRRLIDELNRLVESDRRIESSLTDESAAVFRALPGRIRDQLLLDRDSHGNVQVSKIDTEQLLVERVMERLSGSFKVQGHFFGYEGRCAAPSNFDADYTYALGRLAALLVAGRQSGYLCALERLARPREEWLPRGVPLTRLMQIEQRKGRATPVIRKALVDLEGAPFRSLSAERERWALEDCYRYPGALQYFGPPELCDEGTRTLALEATR